VSIERAMLLAAGRGERMRPLTDTVPKPLLTVRGKPLIVWHLERLSRLGVKQVVINLAWLGDQIRAALGDGQRWQLQIHYSDEGDAALETGGGIFQALPWLGSQPFLVVNADVFSDLDFGVLRIAPEALAHLVLVANPMHHPHGDFALVNGLVQQDGGARWTYSGIGLYRPELFAGCSAGRFPLLPLLRRAIASRRLHGQVFEGAWNDVGSVERLAALQ
jgi:N-acetyl-alpha-D-muramate 1-phosphate uridylyltransferase